MLRMGNAKGKHWRTYKKSVLGFWMMNTKRIKVPQKNEEGFLK